MFHRVTQKSPLHRGGVNFSKIKRLRAKEKRRWKYCEEIFRVWRISRRWNFELRKTGSRLLFLIFIHLVNILIDTMEKTIGILCEIRSYVIKSLQQSNRNASTSKSTNNNPRNAYALYLFPFAFRVQLNYSNWDIWRNIAERGKTEEKLEIVFPFLNAWRKKERKKRKRGYFRPDSFMQISLKAIIFEIDEGKRRRAV